MDIRLIDLLKQGLFGNIKLGENIKDVEKAMLVKEGFFDENEYWQYKNVELQFNDNELVMVNVFLNHEGVIYKNEKDNAYFNILDLENFNLKSSEFKLLCDKEHVLVKKQYSHLNEDSFHLENCVYVSFSNNELSSISVMNLEKI